MKLLSHFSSGFPTLFFSVIYSLHIEVVKCRFALIIVGLLATNTLFAQQEKIDSLTSVINKLSSSDTLKAIQTNQLARFLAREMELDRAISYAQKAIKLSKKLKFKNGEAEAYNIIGIAHVYKGENKEALENLFLGLKKWEESGFQKGVVISYIHIGNVYDDLGNYPEALKNFFKALKLYEKIGSKEGIAMSYNSIGVVYKNQGKYSESLKNYFAALKLWEELGDQRGIAQSYNNIGNVYFEQGKYSESLKNFQASLKIKEEFGDKRGVAGSYLNIGSIYEQQGNYLKAQETYIAALKIFEEIGNKSGIASTLNSLGYIELQLKRPEVAKKQHFEALTLAKEIGMNSLVRDVYFNMTLTDTTLGNYKDAYQNYKQYIVYRDSLVNLENERKSLEIMMGYEFEKKEAIIQAKLKTKNFQRNIAITGLGIMLFLIVLIVYFFRLRSKNLKIEKENLELQRRELETIKQTEQFKSRFLANISHEFRTPLTLINGHMEVLKEKGRKEDFSHFDEIEQNGKRLLNLSNQLLDLSKMESGQYKLQYKKGNVLNEASMLVQSFHSYAEQHGISLILQQTESAKSLMQIPFVYSSEALSVMIVNLISNAIKYTPNGGSVKATIDYKSDKLFVTIADTGKGISAADLPKIFDRFYQVDEPGQRAFAGSGIGLALVKELAVMHGGGVTVESPENEGCVFTIWLENSPGKEQESTESIVLNNLFPVQEQNQLTSDEQQEQDGEMPLVLVVEDQSELRSFIVQNLGNEFRYAEASNGKDGIRLAEELLPDLIISDVMMPDTDGFALCESLKGNVITSHIPIILLTAKAEQKDVLTGLETGTDDYLTKPFSLEEIRLRVRNILRTRQLFRQKFEGSSVPTPDELPDLPIRDREFLFKINVTIQNNLKNAQFGVPDLAEHVFFSVSKLNRKMKSLTGTTPADYIRNMRFQKSVELMREGMNVSEASWEVGFEDPVYFSKVFKKRFGYPPSSVER